MKNLLKSFALCMTFIAFSFASHAQTTTTVYSSRNGAETIAKVATTTDSTLTYIDSVTLHTNEAGLVEIDVIGFAKDTTYSVRGTIMVGFNKRRGTLALDAVTAVYPITRDAILAHTAVGGATFTAVAVNNQIYVRVKGVTDTNVTSIRWFSITKKKSQYTK